MYSTAEKSALTYGYVNIGELQMYYQIHGTGKPLLLLHGGLTTIESSFQSMLPILSSTRQVIAVEQQGHGRTADIDRPMSFEQMADDTAMLLQYLEFEQPVDVFGYSDGGNVGLGLTIRHPELVRTLAIAGTNFSNEGIYPEILEMMSNGTAAEMPDELRHDYVQVAPDPDHFPVYVEKVMQMSTNFPGWSKDDLRRIQQPVLVIVGDRDIVRPEHALELYRLLPDGQLAIFPATDHGLRLDEPDLLLSTILTFIESRS
jgi:pimeloyl-ACP methyl ester carboxylesterase